MPRHYVGFDTGEALQYIVPIEYALPTTPELTTAENIKIKLLTRFH